VNESEECVGLS